MGVPADIRSFFRRQSAPVTVCLIAAMVVVSTVLFLFHDMGFWLIVVQDNVMKPWVYLTYPFNQSLQGYGVVTLLFTCYWMYWVGGSVERDLGAARFGALWVAASVIPALCLAVAGLALEASPVWFLGGGFMPVAVLTVIWGVRNMNAAVRFMMFIPITGMWIAWLTAALVFVQYGRSSLILGAVACVPLALGWVFATDRIPFLRYGRPAQVYKPSKAQVARDSQFFDDVRKREQERNERERLRKMFEGSLNDDKPA